MAYDKKYIGEKEVIKEYLDGREDRIEKSFLDMGINSSSSNFIKFGDGTMICWGDDSLQGHNDGNVKRIALPQTFVNKPKVLTTASRPTNTIGAQASIIVDTSQTNGSTIAMFHTSTTALNVGVEWLAIGKWK